MSYHLHEHGQCIVICRELGRASSILRAMIVEHESAELVPKPDFAFCLGKR